MSTITFDTHQFIRTIQASGIPEGQAEAIAKAFQDAQANAELATKGDIQLVRSDMRELEYRLTIKLGAMMMGAVAVIAALVKLL